MNYEIFKKSNDNSNKTKKSYIVIDAINDVELYELFQNVNVKFNAQKMCKTILHDELIKIKM